jgi:hypothetical protein
MSYLIFWNNWTEVQDEDYGSQKHWIWISERITIELDIWRGYGMDTNGGNSFRGRRFNWSKIGARENGSSAKKKRA